MDGCDPPWIGDGGGCDVDIDVGNRAWRGSGGGGAGSVTASAVIEKGPGTHVSVLRAAVL